MTDLDIVDGLISAKLTPKEAVDLGLSSNTLEVSVPCSRRNILMLEAIAGVGSATDRYRIARAQVMDTPREQLAWIPEVLRGRGYDPSSLLQHQLQFINLASQRSSLFNASEQGTCKTLSALAAALVCDRKRVLVVCPKMVADEWMTEISGSNGRLPPVPIRVIPAFSGATVRRELTGDGVALVNYEALGALEKKILAWKPDQVICDESWRLKNRTAKVTRVMTRVCRDRPVWLLGGTPVGNNVGDLWSQLRLLGQLKDSPYWRFVERYARVQNIYLGRRTVHKIIGLQRVAELIGLLEPVWFRATKASCLDLPPKLPPERVRVSLTHRQQEWYDHITQFGETALAPLSLAGENTTLLRQQQVVGGHLPLPEGIHELPCSKLDWLLGFTDSHLAGDPTVRMIVWCRFNDEIKRIGRGLREVLGESAVVEVYSDVGGLSAETKQLYNSKDPDGPQVIVAQIAMMSSGQNLQGTDINVYFSNSWIYIHLSQSEDRSHRQGRVGAVRYIDLVATGTIDEQIIRALDAKQDLSFRLTPSTA